MKFTLTSAIRSLVVMSVFSIATATSLAQEKVVRRNAAGQVVETYSTVDDKREGAYASFYDNGAKRAEGVYVKGAATGKWIEYHQNGKVYREATLEKGQLTGTWSQYYDTGQLYVRGTTYGCAYGANDPASPLKTGVWTNYHPDGKKASEGEYNENNKTGRWLEYHANGKVYLEGTFAAKGQLTGNWTQYYDTGQVRAQGPTYGCAYGANDLHSPLRTGAWTYYYADGKKASEGSYEKNNKTGRWLDHHANGKLYLDTTFEAGQLTGTWSQYYNDGPLKAQGQAYGCAYGANDSSSPLRTGAWTYYHNNGKKASEGQFEKNNKNGRWLDYHANGNAYLDTSFEAGQLTATWSRYYASGQLQLQGTTYGCAYGANDSGSPLRTGVWVSYDQAGKVTDATMYANNKDSGKASYSTDPDTGITKIAAANPDGSRTVVEVNKDGLVHKPDAPRPGGAPSAADAPDLLAMNADPRTGKIDTVRRNPDGSTTKYTGQRKKDADGTERLAETDDKGNRIETAVAPDGTVTVTRSRPGQGQTTTTTTPDGRVTTVERDVEGGTRTSKLAEDGSIITERRNPRGELVETVTDTGDGWTEHVDAHGNGRRVLRDASGETTTITTDRSGNTTTTVVGRDGAMISRETDIIAPLEPGRAYFEQTLKGTDWDALPRHLKTRYANSERALIETQARRAQEDADAARHKAAEAKRAAEDAAATEQTKKTFDTLRAEQERAGRIAAERKATLDRRAEVEKSYETARNLQRQYDDAVRRGDKEEAKRVMALQDEHHEKSMEVLRHTPEELRELERHSDVRSKLANEITASAHTAANKRMADDKSLQDDKEAVTNVTRFVSIGSQMQQSTRRTTRAADRERALAQAKQEEITRRLNDPATRPEEREILRELQDLAILQDSGAGELLAANARITAAGYALDGALLLSGGKLLQTGGQVIKGTATAVGNVVARRTAAQAGTAGTTGAATGLAGRTTVTLADDAGRTLGMTSRMTAAERAAILESRATASMSGSTASRTGVEITRSELARLHRPGANLTGAEIVTKAAVYRAREAARARLRRAIDQEASDAALAPLQAEFQRLSALIQQAQAAGRALP